MSTTLAPPERKGHEVADAPAEEPALDYLWPEGQSLQERHPVRWWLWFHGDDLYPVLVWSWIGFLVICMFQPESTGVVRPLWVDVASWGILLGLPVAFFGGVLRSLSFGFGLSAILAAVGIAVGISCRAEAHHLGNWWLFETVGFSVLAALSLICLGIRRSTRNLA